MNLILNKIKYTLGILKKLNYNKLTGEKKMNRLNETSCNLRETREYYNKILKDEDFTVHTKEEIVERIHEIDTHLIRINKEFNGGLQK